MIYHLNFTMWCSGFTLDNISKFGRLPQQKPDRYVIRYHRDIVEKGSNLRNPGSHCFKIISNKRESDVATWMLNSAND